MPRMSAALSGGRPASIAASARRRAESTAPAIPPRAPPVGSTPRQVQLVRDAPAPQVRRPVEARRRRARSGGFAAPRTRNSRRARRARPRSLGDGEQLRSARRAGLEPHCRVAPAPAARGRSSEDRPLVDVGERLDPFAGRVDRAQAKLAAGRAREHEQRADDALPGPCPRALGARVLLPQRRSAQWRRREQARGRRQAADGQLVAKAIGPVLRPPPHAADATRATAPGGTGVTSPGRASRSARPRPAARARAVRARRPLRLAPLWRPVGATSSAVAALVGAGLRPRLAAGEREPQDRPLHHAQLLEERAACCRAARSARRSP